MADSANNAGSARLERNLGLTPAVGFSVVTLIGERTP
jgi:hypothetical protein